MTILMKVTVIVIDVEIEKVNNTELFCNKMLGFIARKDIVVEAFSLYHDFLNK